MELKISVIKNPKQTTSQEMKVGDLAIITGGCDQLYIGHILLRAYQYWIDLNRPASTWSNPTMEVQLLSPGDTVILEVK